MLHPSRAPRALVPLLGLALLGAAAGHAAGEAPTVTQPDPPIDDPPAVVLDALGPTAIAADGPRLVWIRRLAGGVRALVERETPSSPERVVVPRLRVSVARLAVGTDAQGRPTAVLATGGEPDPSNYAQSSTDGALFAVRLDGRGGVRRLAVSRARGAEVAPGLRRGVLSFARVERIDGTPTMTLRRGSLTGTVSRVLWHGSPERPIVASAAGAGGRVAFTTHATPGDTNVWNLRVARAGAPTRNLERLPSGFNSNRGYGPLTVDPTGRTVTVSRWESNGDGGVLTTHDLRTLRRTGTTNLGERELGVPLGTLGAAGYRTDLFATCQAPGAMRDRDPCPLEFLPAG